MSDNQAETEKDDLLIEADSICSLIFYREPRGISEQSRADLKKLIDRLRPVTDEIMRERRRPLTKSS